MFMSARRLFAVVLAAGRASRFGATKQLAEYRGEPLVRRAVRNAERICGGNTILVVGSDWRRVHQAAAPLAGFLVRNEAYDSGMASSIGAGVRAVSGPADAVLVMLADQPLVGVDELRRLVDAWHGADSLIACSAHGELLGPPVIFPSLYFAELMSLRGDTGARSVLEKHAERVVRVACESAAVDVDTPTDLASLGE